MDMYSTTPTTNHITTIVFYIQLIYIAYKRQFI